MAAKLTASLRAAPTTVPAVGALALFVVWSTDQAGYPVTHWSPGALIVLVLLAMALAVVRLRPAEMPLTVCVAFACLAAYTAFSYLSIAWAAVPGDAWEGSNRTLLYLLTFALFAGWRQHAGSAALLLTAWVLAMIALAAFAALHVDAASAVKLRELVPDGRLLYPTGYPNANAAQWLMALWPALLLARSERLPWALRGVLAGGSVLLAGVALLSQSRGSLYATPVMLVLVFALLPGRLRTFAVLVPVAAGIAAAAPAVLRVGNTLHEGSASHANVRGAVIAMFAAAIVVAAVVAAGAAFESRRSLSERAVRRWRQAIAGAALAALLVAVVAGLVAAGNPVTRVEKAWHSFEGGYANSSGKSRLVSGFGSNRYDFYRVAVDEFVAHPIAGIGVDNFQQQYLRHGHSAETPRYPHSLELRTLTQTGLIGAAIAVAGLLAALLAVARAVRRPDADALSAAVAAAAAAGFSYWVVHGSVDWFWEFAGLGAPAFAMLGLACSLAPARVRPAPGSLAPLRSRRARAPTGAALRHGGLRAGIVARPAAWVGNRPWLAALPVVVVLAWSLAVPWLSQLEVQSAARIWPRAPRHAYARLADAAKLNPLSDEAYVVAGSIALRFGDLARADREFARALARSPGDAYATLERGAIASAGGERAQALALLERAIALAPREGLYREAAALVRRGGRIDVARLNRLILGKARQFA
jgi:tetratricopeptide (TPR) repeat protein